MTSDPSLGRKRPRRAAIARGATAPQQYATALHKAQELSNHFRCKTARNPKARQKSYISIIYTITSNGCEVRDNGIGLAFGLLSPSSRIRDRHRHQKRHHCAGDSLAENYLRGRG